MPAPNATHQVVPAAKPALVKTWTSAPARPTTGQLWPRSA